MANDPIESGIVYGTDFSESAREAGDVAAAIAAHLGEPLTVVHAFDEPSRILLPKEVRDALKSFEHQQLHEEAQRLDRERLVIKEAFCEGEPSERLVRFAADSHPRLLLVSSGQHKASVRWILGSVAERVSQSSPAPTLVVRNPAPLINWLGNKRKLRVFVAADYSLASDAVLEWARWLRRLGECELIVAYVATAMIAEFPRGVEYSPSAANLLEEIAITEETNFRRRVGEVLSSDGVRVCFERGLEHSGARLLEMAAKEEVDLIVVGRNERHGLSRMTYHVSRKILHYAQSNVAAIPIPAAAIRAGTQGSVSEQ